MGVTLRFYYTIWHFVTSFDYHIREKKEAICDRIWVVVLTYDHTLSLNNIIPSIHSGTDKILILEKL